MCGRYTIHDKAADLNYLRKYYKLQNVAIDSIPERFNAAPSQFLPVIFENQHSGNRVLNSFRWGLIPPWAKDEKIGFRMINARGESLSEKSSFRSPFKKQRCLIPISGFFEWDKTKDKMPHYYHLKDYPVMTLAGLYERWKSPLNIITWTYTVITTDANKLVEQVHPRMPAIIHPDEFSFWLDPTNDNTEELTALLKPYPESEFESWTVPKLVNRVSYDAPDILEKMG